MQQPESRAPTCAGKRSGANGGRAQAPPLVVAQSICLAGLRRTGGAERVEQRHVITSLLSPVHSLASKDRYGIGTGLSVEDGGEEERHHICRQSQSFSPQ